MTSKKIATPTATESTNGRATKPKKTSPSKESPKKPKVKITRPKEEAPLRLTTEQVLEAASYDRDQALALVDLYYSLQDLRKATANQGLAISQERNTVTDPHLISMITEDLKRLELQTVRGLKAFAEASPLGQWCLSIAGVGPILTAGFLAHIDLKRCSCKDYRHLRGMERGKIPPHNCPGLATAGAIHRFAGMIDPELLHWGKGQRRPYNARLKQVCYHLGQCFKRTPLVQDVSGEEYLYVRLYRQRKILEVERNEAGLNADRARSRLQDCLGRRSKISPEQREIWASGKLQAIGLDHRAARYAVCLFLSHYHTVGREILGLPNVVPWVIEHGGHIHYIPPPLWRKKEVKKK